MPADRPQCCVRSSSMPRKVILYAIFLWKSAWRVGSEHVWRASANPKKKIITQMSTISGSVRTVRYSCQRRWNSDEYESKYCRGGVEQSGDGCVRYIWIRRGICGVCGSEPDRCGDDKRSCEYSVGREPDSACGRDLWRNDECGRSAESGDRSVL